MVDLSDPFISAVEAGIAIREGRISSRELTEQMLDRALSDQCGRQSEALLAGGDAPQIESQAVQPVSVLQLLARDYPAGRADVRTLPTLP